MTSALDPWVREASAGDLVVVETHKSLSLEEASSYRGSLLTVDRPALRSVVLVAGLGSTVMGSLVVSESQPDVWRITHLHVVRECREVGIGDALLSRCLEMVSHDGATWCDASVLPGDRSMKNLFERHGLVAQTIVVGKRLSGPST